MARVRLYLPDHLAERARQELGDLNWSLMFRRRIEAELKRRARDVPRDVPEAPARDVPARTSPRV